MKKSTITLRRTRKETIESSPLGRELDGKIITSRPYRFALPIFCSGPDWSITPGACFIAAGDVIPAGSRIEARVQGGTWCLLPDLRGLRKNTIATNRPDEEIIDDFLRLPGEKRAVFADGGGASALLADQDNLLAKARNTGKLLSSVEVFLSADRPGWNWVSVYLVKEHNE